VGRYVLRRLLQMIPVFLGTTFIIYFLMWSLKSDPFSTACGPRPCPASYVAKMRAKYNMDDPIFIQYFKYLGRLFQGDFGVDFNDRSVADIIGKEYPVTIRLALIAVAITAIIGVTAGVLTGLRGRGFMDNMVLVSTLLLISLPTFVLGYLLKFGVFKIGIDYSVTSKAPVSELILPGIVLGAISVAYASRITRASVAESKRSDYIRTALAKGLTGRRIVFVHLLRNTMIPVLTFLGTEVGGLMGGAIVTEAIFNVPGIGGQIYKSINLREGVVVVGIITILVLVYLVVNLLVDLTYALLDPRIRYE